MTQKLKICFLRILSLFSMLISHHLYHLDGNRQISANGQKSYLIVHPSLVSITLIASVWFVFLMQKQTKHRT